MPQPQETTSLRIPREQVTTYTMSASGDSATLALTLQGGRMEIARLVETLRAAPTGVVQ